jgi:Pectate lyase superfamily protein
MTFRTLIWIFLALALDSGLAPSKPASTSPVSVKQFGAKGDGSTDDFAALQRALKSKTALLFPAGTYKVGQTLTISRDNTSLSGEGSTVILALDSFAIASGANNISIAGLTFEGAGFHGTGRIQKGIKLTNNRFQNTSGKDAVVFDGVLSSSLIDSNTFQNIAPPNFLASTYSSLGFPGCWSRSPPICDAPGTGIVIMGGLDQTSITNNLFDVIANDGMHIGWNHIAGPSQYFLTKNNSISYNQLSRVHRMGLEIQAIWSWPNCGINGQEKCDGHLDLSTNTQIKGNYFHDPFLAYIETYGYSLALLGDGQYINNAAIGNVPNQCLAHLGYGMEVMGNNVLTQGNVVAADDAPSCNPHGWEPITYGASRAGTTFTTQNNVLCGDQATTVNFKDEPYSAGAKVNRYNYIANACPNAGRLANSVIALAFTSADVKDSRTGWQISVESALPVKYVQFFVDASATPVITQEVQDVNTNFATDRKWLYHAALDTSKVGGGKHTITAKATDVSGKTKDVTQSFTLP